MELDRIRAEDFAALVGTRLELRAATTAMELELAALQRLPEHRLRALPPFSITLRGGREVVLGQGMVVLVHPALGPMEVFLVPIGPDALGMRYEITFN